MAVLYPHYETAIDSPDDISEMTKYQEYIVMKSVVIIIKKNRDIIALDNMSMTMILL